MATQPGDAGTHQNLIFLQQAVAVTVIDHDLKALHAADPAFYNDGDFNELLDRRKQLTDAAKRPPVA